MSIAVWDQTLLPATRHKWTQPTLTRDDDKHIYFTGHFQETWISWLPCCWTSLSFSNHWYYEQHICQVFMLSLTHSHQVFLRCPFSRHTFSWSGAKSSVCLFDVCTGCWFWRQLLRMGRTHSWGWPETENHGSTGMCVCVLHDIWTLLVSESKSELDSEPLNRFLF